jgi:DNA-binding protein HU-beta
MNKEGLVEQLASNKASGLESKAAATRALNAVLAAIETGIKKNGEVQLIGFGTFTIKSRPARKGRNPGTGEVIKIKGSVANTSPRRKEFIGCLHYAARA